MGQTPNSNCKMAVCTRCLCLWTLPCVSTSRTVAVAGVTGMKAPTLFTTMYMHAAPQDAVLASIRRTGAIGRFWHPRTSAMQDRANGFRRISLLGPCVSRDRLRSDLRIGDQHPEHRI